MRTYSDERRCAERVPTEGLGALCRFDERLCPAAVVDLSPTGVRLSSYTSRHMGAEANVVISTHGRGRIRARGAVVHLDPVAREIGIEFHEMDLNSRKALDELVSDLHIGQRYVPRRI